MHRFRHVKDQVLFLENNFMDCSRDALSQQDYFLRLYQKPLDYEFQVRFSAVKAYVSCLLYLGAHWLINELKGLGYIILEESLDNPRHIQTNRSIPEHERNLLEKDFFKCDPTAFKEFINHWNAYGRH